MDLTKIKEKLSRRETDSVLRLLREDPSNGPTVLAAVLILAEEAKNYYLQKGISEKIFNETMADISIWAENYRRKTGYCGIDELGWIMNHLNLELFALGRLQFRPSVFYDNDSWTKINNYPLKVGDNILEVHIPQGRSLLYEECDISFESASFFFKKYFNYEFEYFTCHSWLLSPTLKEILPKDSNIINFQDRFTLIAVDKNDNQAEERIFDKQFGSNSNSSLAIKIKELKNKGINIGSGIGVIRKDKLK